MSYSISSAIQPFLIPKDVKHFHCLCVCVYDVYPGTYAMACVQMLHENSVKLVLPPPQGSGG